MSEAVDKDIAGPELPADYGTPAYEARWVRKKLNLPLDAKTSVVQGAMHVQESHAHGYEAYITAYRCDDKQGEIARQSVTIEEQAAEIAALRARLGRFDAMKIATLEARVKELESEPAKLQAIIAQPGNCLNCGDCDPFRVQKWGQATADRFHEAAEDQRDAARYRWIRSKESPSADVCLKPTPDHMLEFREMQDLDAAIDAAIAKGPRE